MENRLHKWIKRSFVGLLKVFIVIVLVAGPVKAQEDILEYVKINYSTHFVDRINDTRFCFTSIENISQKTLTGPFRVVIDSITSPVVSMGNPDGYNSDGKPYYEYQSPEVLQPGAVTDPRKWIFANAGRIRFTYTVGEITGTVVRPEPTVTFTADPESINLGENSQLSWSSMNADNCSISPGIGTVALSGSLSVSPSQTTTYTITVQGTGGSTTQSATIQVTNPNVPPQVTFSHSSITIEKGDTVELSWTSERADNVYIDNRIGMVGQNSTYSVSPQATTTYTITGVSSFGSGSDQITVYVTGNPLPQHQGSFGEQYNDLIPVDSTVDTYEAKRFALIAGNVNDIFDNPLANVTVTVFGRPEYGSCQTGADGQFSIPVEGGENLTVNYEKEGYMSAQRQVYVPWNDFAITDTIQMLIEDMQATVIDFDGDPDTVISHRSTPVTDEFGTRACTIIIKGDNALFAVNDVGEDIFEITSGKVRATEYTTPESMPANLPDTSAFTYCVELSIDHIEDVRFENPVAVFIDNFLNFDVGDLVPVGSYNRNRAQWIPEKNGRVVKLLDTNNDNVADAMDIDGDDLPDLKNGSEPFTDEIIGLIASGDYKPGDTLWRFETDHFTPFDTNWPPKFPPDAVVPQAPMPIIHGQEPENKECKNPLNSYVSERSRTFHEDIPIPGTDMTLHYSSHGITEGTIISIPLTGATIPSSLQKVSIRLWVAGQWKRFTYDAQENLIHEWIWDGRDRFGNRFEHPVRLRILIQYHYIGYYGRSYDEFIDWFGKFPEEASQIASRLDIKKKKFVILNINPSVAKENEENYIAKGWTLSNHHSLNPLDPSVLFKGDGSKVDAFNTNLKYNRIDYGAELTPIEIGSDMPPDEDMPPEDDMPPGEEPLLLALLSSSINPGFSSPSGMALDAAGNIYVADTYNNRIKKIDTNGVITTIAGNGGSGSNPTDYSDIRVVATESRLYWPMDVCVDGSGNVYFIDLEAEGEEGYIRKISPDGMLSNPLGNYTFENEDERIRRPEGITLDNNGNILIADKDRHCIRMLDTAGVLTTIAGTGSPGYSGDNGSCLRAELKRPTDVKVDLKGNVYILDRGNYVVRRIDIDGTINTIAGTGYSGTSGDGGPAIAANLNYPTEIELDPQGNLYILENAGIRKVNTDGVITSIDYKVKSGEMSSIWLEGRRDLEINDAGEIYLLFEFGVGKLGPTYPYLSVEGESNMVFTENNGLGHVISPAGRHEKTVDLETGRTLRQFQYNYSDNILNAIIDQFGNTIDIERDNSRIATAIISSEGLRTQLVIDENNHLTQIVLPDGNNYQFDYTVNGLMTLEKDPEGNEYTHVFSEAGFLEEVLDQNGGHWRYNLLIQDDGSELITISTAEDNQSSYLDITNIDGTYSSIITEETGSQTIFTQTGMTAHKSTSCGMELELEYDTDTNFKYNYLKFLAESTPSGIRKTTTNEKIYIEPSEESPSYEIRHETNVNGKTSYIINNIFEANKRVFSPEGRSAIINYDAGTLLTTKIQTPGLFDHDFEYDEKGRLRYSTIGSRQTEYRYSTNGFLETIIDSENNQVSYSHDAMGRVTQISRPDNSIIRFNYDANGNMTVLTTPTPSDHSFSYNTVNLKTGYTTPISGGYIFQYDKDRRPTATLFPSGKQIRNVYANGRLEQIQTPEGIIDMTYLCGNKIGDVSKGGESIAYDYDGKLIINETLAGTLNESLTFTYNNDFLVRSMSYAGGTENYQYDGDDLLVQAGDFSVSRQSDTGFAESVSDGIVNIARSFNGYGEMTSQTTTVNSQDINTWSVSRDNRGRIKTKTRNFKGISSNYEYTYDSTGRLLTVIKDGSLVEEYQYDLNGTRIYEMNVPKGIAGRTFTYSAEDHLLNAGNVQYQYTLDGFLSSRNDGSEVTNYTYSSRGELLDVTLPDNTIIEYLHDPLGRRIAKKIDGIVVEKYLWQGLTRLLAVFDGSGTLLMRFEYGDSRMPVSMTTQNETVYLLYDQVGSLTTVADDSGNVIKQIAYDTFGNIITDSHPAFKVPFGFAGGFHDTETGLVRFGHRDYDPEIGRWTAKDPIFFNGGDTDLYGYALNDPVNHIDVNGLSVLGQIPKAWDRIADAWKWIKRARFVSSAGKIANEIKEGKDAENIDPEDGYHVLEDLVNMANPIPFTDATEGEGMVENVIDKIKERNMMLENACGF